MMDAVSYLICEHLYQIYPVRSVMYPASFFFDYTDYTKCVQANLYLASEK